MCKTCNNTGGITINNGWFAEFHLCPDSHCDYEARSLDESIAILKSKLVECESETA